MHVPVVGKICPKSFAIGAVAGAGLASFVDSVRDAFLKVKGYVMPAKVVAK